MRLPLVAAFATLVSLPACSSSHTAATTAETDAAVDVACSKPASTTYDCTYAAPEAGACEATDAFSPQAVGCVATLPSCDPNAPQTVEKCLCTVFVDAAAWKCPY
jgi:hypothetical protein